MSLPWTQSLGIPTGSDGGDELEALQTDVMRFLAIVALCLMAIFALVKNIPAEPPDPRPQIISKELLEEQIAGLRQQLEDMTQRLAQVKEQIVRTEEERDDKLAQATAAEQEAQRALERRQAIEQAIARTEEERQRLEAQTTAAEQEAQLAQVRKREVAEEAARLEAERNRLQVQAAEAKQEALRAQIHEQTVSEEVERLERRMSEHRVKLSSLASDLTEGKRSLSSLRREQDQERRKLDQTQRRLVATEKALETSLRPPPKETPKEAPPKETPPTTPAETPAETQPEAPAAPESSEREGFSLGFSSEDTFDTLVRTGRVDFFARTGSKTWKLQTAGRGVQFVATKSPSKIYVMNWDTVPQAYVRALGRKVTVFRAEGVEWSVTLPNSTEQRIQQLMANHKGGELIIGQGGAVSLEP